MSTRSIFSFCEPLVAGSIPDIYHVYMHSDGYPAGAVDALKKALPFAWTLPRYEADEFAAAFVAGNKGDNYRAQLVAEVLAKARALPVQDNYDDYAVTFDATAPLMVPRHIVKSEVSSGGNIRLLKSGDWKDIAPGDIAYRYEVTIHATKGLMVRGFSTDWSEVGDTWNESEVFYAPLAKLKDMDFKALQAWEKRIQAKAERAAKAETTAITA